METGRPYVLRQIGIVFLIALVGILFLAAGLMIGYAVLGEGKDAWAILQPSTWQNIVTKFTGK